jgi:hypothetical protein
MTTLGKVLFFAEILSLSSKYSVRNPALSAAFSIHFNTLFAKRKETNSRF